MPHMTVFCALLALFLQPLQAQAPRSHHQWHTLTLSFQGPESSELSEENPFTDYRLLVEFAHAEARYVVRGFYAADGNAAETGADSGRIWQARFTPDRPGEWTYRASLRQGDRIAVENDPAAGASVALEDASGRFTVTASPVADGRDFRGRGRIVADGHYLRFVSSGDYWLKGGADSPENFLAYADFDGTYRHSAEVREGESRPSEALHTYEPHLRDWSAGDPTWGDDKGKGIIGAVNYLASTGMNAVYFLAMNIGGDGKDVWPYHSHETFTRFDCSKLDQWEILFQHMQSKGILLHLVTQETENERLLDDGDTGFLRKLYYRELIARFGHHLALVWNLGEENGPADFSPHGQTSEQQRAMASYLKNSDPYGHPVVIHTHSTPLDKDHLLPALLGHEPLDGLSFQINEPQDVHSEVIKWREKSQEAGRPWLIAMDEIGPWQIGVRHDQDDPDHDEMRRYVLWGSLMGGAAGVEWYFGAHQKGNDLTTQDWRSRANMWEQTRHALAFFEQHLPYWEMQPADELTPSPEDYCFAKPGELYALYAPDAQQLQLDLGQHAGPFEIRWFSPKNGGPLQQGSLQRVSGPGLQSLGAPPTADETEWVVLIRRARTR